MYADTLTSLRNSAVYTSALSKKLESHEHPHALFYLPVKETPDHAYGDEVLKQLRGNARNSDCVARLGGDEFAVLLLLQTGLSLKLWHHTVVLIASEPLVVHDQEIRIGTSDGAQWSASAMHLRRRWKAADQLVRS